MSAVVEPAPTADAAEQAATNQRMRTLLAGPNPGTPGERIALLHFTGRRTGRPYTVPAGVHTLDCALVVATGSGWRYNFAGGADGEMTWRGERRPTRFRLVTDDERTARGYLELYRRYGPDAAPRRLGIVVRGDEPPELAAFARAVAEGGISLVEATLSAALPPPAPQPPASTPGDRPPAA